MLIKDHFMLSKSDNNDSSLIFSKGLWALRAVVIYARAQSWPACHLWLMHYLASSATD